MSAKAVTQSNANANATSLPQNCHPPNQLWLADANADNSLAGGDSCADLGLPQVFAASVLAFACSRKNATMYRFASTRTQIQICKHSIFFYPIIVKSRCNNAH